MPSTVQIAKGKLGAASRFGNKDDVTAARRDLAAAKIEAYVSHVVDTAPPLTKQQASKIAALLLGGGVA